MGHILSLIYNKKRRANRKTHSQAARIGKDQLCRLQRWIMREELLRATTQRWF